MFAVVATTCVAADSTPAALLSKLTSLAGSNSQNCGFIPLHADRAPAIACAKNSSSAYRVAFQLSGVDSHIWQGAARDEHAKLWVAFYESDSSDGAGSGPTLSVLRCREILFVAEGGEVLDCQPISGGT